MGEWGAVLGAALGIGLFSAGRQTVLHLCYGCSEGVDPTCDEELAWGDCVGKLCKVLVPDLRG